ncbi:CocE/NonD family hydrolase, partial [Streptomyces sp. NPDC002896]|uniref:CocE/NonD family hydrolase n=1 Tax=Streptomyces sp. NPDC002896 TaxID=3154438 RepID=UPI0033269E44
HYLLIDAIDHENHHVDRSPAQHGPDADHTLNTEALQGMLPRYLDPALDFFDIFLRHQGAAEDLPKVRWHQVHAAERGFRESATWPPTGSVTYELHLAEGELAEKEPVTGTASWVHEPADPVPSASPNSFAYLQTNPRLQDWSTRPDVAVFDAARTPDALDLTGPVTLSLHLSTTGPSSDLFAKLLDVHPDGEAELIAHGRAHVPGPAHRVDLSLGHAGYRLRPGHRLRLHLHSSDHPEFVLHPGTDDNPWLATDTVKTRQEIRLGGGDGARLRLTVTAAT